MRITLIAIILFSLMLTAGCAGQDSAAQDMAVLKAIDNNEMLTKLSEICPSELVQKTDITFDNKTKYCKENQQSCLSKCLKGSSDHCFGLGNHFNIVEAPEKYSRPLYAKSCSLGLVSACTNTAAGIKRNQGLDAAECYTPTFKKTCELEDPWGCTMYAVSLFYGEGVEKDNDKALSALRGSCRFGETDRACSEGLELSQFILKGDTSEK